MTESFPTFVLVSIKKKEYINVTAFYDAGKPDETRLNIRLNTEQATELRDTLTIALNKEGWA